MKIIRKSISKTETENFEIKIGDKYICHENWVDGKLSYQYFTTIKKNHNGFEPQNMRFEYYGGEIDSQKVILDDLEGNYESVPKPQLIHDLENFNDFDNLYCFWLDMDGMIYRITDRDPLPAVIRVTLYESVYDISDEFINKLKEDHRVKNITKTRNVLPNREDCGEYSLHFRFIINAEQTKQYQKTDNFLCPEFAANIIGFEARPQ